MKYAYVRARKASEVEEFRLKNKHDELFVDTVNSYGVSSGSSLMNLLAKISNGDELVIESFESACGSISELCSLLWTCADKGINLVSAEGIDTQKFNSEAKKLLKYLPRFEHSKQDEAKFKKMGRPQEYPDGFWDVYSKYRYGSIDDRNSEKAAAELNKLAKLADTEAPEIKVHTFYKLVREFER
ncbi:hypothetical protein PCCS19_20970 [Paenibacillus sp. CCS19]|uniref:recombinase family protein n=1 Tax=Paenibacillus sp. CCS19 TaxID=3158387 RepID=UPI002562AA2A|nr:recombinase family protein [Paenibacillus cellulosilyticus]GMK39043.1 hypothetical protein PCCS19_20970 [Paenibacillus cellulosilyticus]